MGIRSRMTMRAVIKRNQAPGTDDYGQPGPTNWQIIAVDVPCYVWLRQAGTVVGNQRTVTVEAPTMVVPLDTDITVRDQVSSIADRLGKELFGKLHVDAVLRRKDHLEVRLDEYT